MRFVPVGEMAMPGSGAIWIGLGMASTFIAASIGSTQRNPKTVLAYSSVSQMADLPDALVDLVRVTIPRGD